MTRLVVHSCGPGMTVQDAGRIGAQRFGISGSGVMDRDSYMLANALVGADDGAAVLEFSVFGGRFSVDEAVMVAVTGGSCPIAVDGRSVAPWISFRLDPDSTLTIGPLSDAVYGYLAIAGGIDVPLFMGSRSTHSRSDMGGFNGRALQPDDVLNLYPATGGDRTLGVGHLPNRAKGMIRIVAGPQDDYFSSEAWDLLLGQPFTVTNQRDRMGMLLDGPKLEHTKGFNIVSDAVTFGSIQVPGAGKPIVLLADRQSTGGYPKIATVASCDLGGLAQTVPGDIIRFECISAEDAEVLARASHSTLQRMIDRLEPIDSRPGLSTEHLLSVNLVDGVVDAVENKHSDDGTAS